MTEEAEAAGIICSLRAADLAGWTPPWKASGPPPSEATAKEDETAWPAVARGKRTRSSRSGSAANKGRWARGSPASPLDYSGGSGSGASTSGGEDGAFCSPATTVASARGQAVITPTAAPASSSLAKVGSAGAARRTLILPAPPARTVGQRSRKKMRLPEVKQLVMSLSAENAGLRQEMESLQRAWTALCQENGRLETRLEYSSSSSKRKRIESEEEEERRQGKPQQAGGGFVLPDLNVPAQDVVDAPAAP